MTESPPRLDIPSRVRRAVEAALDRQAVGLQVRQLEHVCDFTDYFVICSGANSRQVEAIADRVDDRLRSDGVKPLHIEGAGVGRWILMDYGDFLVHVLDADRRDYYRLEDIWSDAPDVTTEFVESPSSS